MVEAPEFREMAGSLISKNGRKVLKPKVNREKKSASRHFAFRETAVTALKLFTAAPVIS